MEAEVLFVAKVHRVKADEQLQPAGRKVPHVLVLQARQRRLVSCEEGQPQVNWVIARAAPGPSLRGALVRITQNAAAVRADNALEELYREARQLFLLQTRRQETGRRERDLQGGVIRRRRGGRDVVTQRTQPAPRSEERRVGKEWRAWWGRAQ